jgi:LacI family transcriptional regulator
MQVYMKQRRVTLEQIAREINISRVTISKVINGHDSVSMKNRQIILDALKKYGYRENKAAKSLAANRSYTVGLVCFDSPRSPYFLRSVLAGVREAENQYRDYGLAVDISVTRISTPEEQIERLNSMAEARYDAIAIIPNDIYKPAVTRDIAATISRITDGGIPLITVNRDVADTRRTAYIGSDYIQSGRMAAELLVKIVGTGEILIAVTGPYNHYIDVSSRLTGALECLQRHPEITVRPFYNYSGDHEDFIRHAIAFKESCTGNAGLIDISYQTGHIARQISNHGGKQLYTIGFDQYAGFHEDLDNQYIEAVISQDMFAQGYYSISYLFQLLTDEIPVIPIVPIKNEIILRANADSYQ